MTPERFNEIVIEQIQKLAIGDIVAEDVMISMLSTALFVTCFELEKEKGICEDHLRKALDFGFEQAVEKIKQ